MKPKISRWILAVVSMGVMIPFMVPYMTLDPADSRVVLASPALQYPVLVAHIGFAFVALVSGFLQFVDRIRLNHPRLHRYVGKVYVCCVGASGILALVLVGYVEHFAKAVSFLTLTLLWLATSWRGYRSAVRGDYRAHRIWMIRSFGFTLVAVSARLLVPLLLLIYAALHRFTLPGGREWMVQEVLNVNIWVGLVLNMGIVEWVILSREPIIRKRGAAE